MERNDSSICQTLLVAVRKRRHTAQRLPVRAQLRAQRPDLQTQRANTTASSEDSVESTGLAAAAGI